MPNDIEEQIKELKPSEVLVLQVPVENSIQTNISAVRVLQEAGYSGIYVTFFKDYLELTKLMGEGGVDVSKVTFVDGIAKLYGLAQSEEKNVTYIDGPLSLDVATEAITKTLALVEGDKKFVFLDSLTIVLLYNSLSRTIEFVKSLSELLKKAGYAEVISLPSRGLPNESLMSELKQLSGKVTVCVRIICE